MRSFALLNLWNFCTFIAYLKNCFTESKREIGNQFVAQNSHIHFKKKRFFKRKAGVLCSCSYLSDFNITVITQTH